MSKIRIFLMVFLYTACAVSFESVAKNIGIPGFSIPDLALLFVLFLSFYEVSSYGALMVFLVGLVVDLSGGILLGPWAGAYVLCFGGLSLFSDRIFVESWLSLCTLTVIFVVLSHFLFLLIAFDPLGQLASAWPILLGRAFVTALVAPFLFSLYRKILFPTKGDVSRGIQSKRSTY